MKEHYQTQLHYYCTQCGKRNQADKIEVVRGNINNYVKIQFTCNSCLARVYVRMYEGGR